MTQETEAAGAEQRYRALFDHAHDSVFVLDDRGAVQECNKNALALVGTIERDVLGRRFVELVEIGPNTPDAAALERHVLDGELRSQTLAIARPDGERVLADASATSVVVGDRRLVFVVARDVTAQRRTQAQLQMSDRMVTVGTLAAGVAHEINNPLAAVIANIDLALRDLAEVGRQLGGVGGLLEVEDELRDAREAAERVRLIVRDLKVFSRAEDDKRGPVDIERVLDSSLRMAWNEIRHAARVRKEYGRVRSVLANESRLGQVFLNLLVNAAQAIREGHAEENEISVVTRTEPGGSIVIEICDTGAGMSPEVVRRLFTPFFTTKPPGVGTGLGLSISHRIITELGGDISVESTPGRGSCFRVRLPAAAMESDEGPQHGTTPQAARRGRILVVDDEPIIAKAVQRTLAAEHEVVGATSAREALALIADGQRFDVILTDLMMPQMTGMDLHGELMKVAPEQAARMIFLTGGAFTTRSREFLDEAPNPRLEKPFDAQQLRTLINGIVR